MKKVLVIVLLVLGVIVGMVIFRKDHTISKETAIEKCAFPNSAFVKWHDRDIHYLEFGDKSKQQILMIHGFGGSVHNFKSMFELMQDDFYVLAVDLPGFALSDQPNMEALGTESYLEAYEMFMKFVVEEFELNDFHIVGNSLGGWISWETALVLPEKVKSLTLLCSAGYEMDKVSKNATEWLKTWYADVLFRKGMPMFISESNAKKIIFNQSKVTKEGIEKNYYNINKEGNFPFMLKLATAGEFPDTSKITQIITPTLIIWGAHDKIIPSYHAEKFARDIAGSKLVMFEECGHVPQIELPEETKQAMLEFFSTLPVEEPVELAELL